MTVSHKINTGDFFVSSWGYDQTNITYYIVTKVTAKTVTLAEVYNRYISQDALARDCPSVSYDSYSDYALPTNEIKERAKPTRRKLKESEHWGLMTNISSYSFARIWDGKPHRQTAQGYGH